MGEIADMMIDGEACASCGEILDGKAPGIPRYCPDCDPETRKRAKADRRDAATKDFAAASTTAARHGLYLVRKSETLYHLFPPDRRWLQNVYPGNCRLYWDHNKAKPPFLDIESPWTLLDIVEATVQAMEESHG